MNIGVIVFSFVTLFYFGSCTKVEKNKKAEKIEADIGIGEKVEIIAKSDLNKEIVKIKKELSKSPEDARLHLKLSQANLQKRNIYSALKSAQDAVKYKPNLEEGYKIMGDSYFARENYNEAVENYKKALSISEDYAEAHYGLANCYFVAKDYEKAKEEYIIAIKQNPSFISAYFNLGAVYSKLKDYENAVQNFMKVITLDTNNFKAYLNLGIVFEKNNNKTEAIKYYEKYLKYQPSDIEVKRWVAELKE